MVSGLVSAKKALSLNEIDKVADFLDKKKDKINQDEYYELMKLCLNYDRAEIFKKLVDAGADINYGCDPVISTICSNGENVFFDYVKEKIDYSFKDQMGDNLLMMAIYNGNYHIADSLVEKIDPLDKNMDGKCALDYAKERNYPNLQRMLFFHSITQ